MTYPPDRNYGCRLITNGTLKGLRTVVLENQKLRITVLVDKGTDIWEFLYKPLDIDFMWRSPMQLRNPAHFVPSSASSWGFWYDFYEGGWQEILPSGGIPSSFMGAEFGLHGESSTIPWEFRVITDTPYQVTVAFWVRLYRSPFYIEKKLTLTGSSSILTIEETLINEGVEPIPLMWGHHPAIGIPFLDDSCTIDTDAATVHTLPDLSFETQRFPPGIEFDWPVGISRNGARTDLSRVPSPHNKTADMLFLSGFKQGWYAITNQNLHLGFGLCWDKEIFPYLWFWQVCGGSLGYPWYGRTYNMALEIFTSRPKAGLAGAVDDGSAIWLEPGDGIQTRFAALAYTGTGRVSKIDPSGLVVLSQAE
jgi:hypothetical protein